MTGIPAAAPAPTATVPPATLDACTTTTFPARTILGFVRAYQFVRLGRVSPCRFVPTCSEYAAQAVAAHGSRRGLSLALRRLGRCRPGGPSGYDPVPEKVG